MDESFSSTSSVVRSKLKKHGLKSSALLCTENYVVKRFGPQMPLVVAECLAKNVTGKASVRCNEGCGWSWLVCGRRLFVWPLGENDGPPDENYTVVGKDLMLPPSDVAYNAELAVLFKDGGKFPCCIAVSPEGVVRYWSNVRFYSNWVDVNCQLGGEEVCQVVLLPPMGCLAVTTSGSLVLIHPQLVENNPSVTVKVMTSQNSWFGGLGKKMSSLLGYLPSPRFLESRAIKVVIKPAEHSWVAFLLVEHVIQAWKIESKRHELCCEYNLKPVMKSLFFERQDDPVEWEIFDMKDGEGSLFFILAGCVSSKTVMILAFSLEVLSDAPQLVKSFTLTQEDFDILNASSNQPISCLRFLPSFNSCFLYNERVVLAVCLEGLEASEQIEFHSGSFLGGSVYCGQPIFFSTSHSYVCLERINHLDPVGTTQEQSIFPALEQDSQSHVTAVKNSFLLHVRKKVSQSTALLTGLFNNMDLADDSPLAEAVAAVSLEIINQVSSRDPRWDKRPSPFGIDSLQLGKQLEEKEHVHSLFIAFIEDLLSSGRLGFYSEADPKTNFQKTLSVMADHHERVVLVSTLCKLRSRYPAVIERAANRVCLNLPENCMVQKEEYFFAQTELAFNALRELCNISHDESSVSTAFEVYINSLHDINCILIEAITSVIRSAERKGLLNNERKYIPALSFSSPNGIFDCLLEQAMRTLSVAKNYGKTLDKADVYFGQLFSLTDIILFTQKDFASREQFSNLTERMVQPFIEGKFYKEALMLAEKFTHFNTMIRVCVSVSDEQRLCEYISRFGDQGLCRELFKFYVTNKMLSELVKLKLPSEFEAELDEFLTDYPEVKWISKARKGDYNESFDILKTLGERINDDPVRKTRILSLAKLAGLLADRGASEEVDRRLWLLSVQEELAEELLVRVCGKKGRSLSAEELIGVLICEENDKVDEWHYKRALEVVDCVREEEARKRLWAAVWETCVRRDGPPPSLPPEQVCSSLTLFKLMALLVREHQDPARLIPPYHRLIQLPGLAHLTADPNMLYLLRYGYEQFSDFCGAQDFLPNETMAS